MTDSLGSARRHSGSERRLRRMVAAASALLIFIAWCTVAAVLVQKHRDAIAAELRQDTNLARALTEQAVRVLATADQATVRVRDAVLSGQDTAPELSRFASETGLAPAILVQLSLIDAQGRFAASNLDPDGSKTGHVDLSTREHVRAHLKPESLPAAERRLRTMVAAAAALLVVIAWCTVAAVLVQKRQDATAAERRPSWRASPPRPAWHRPSWSSCR